MADSKKYSIHQLIESYKDSLGAEKATQLLCETMKKLGLENRKELTREEVISICSHLKDQAGFVGIVAGILLTRLSAE